MFADASYKNFDLKTKFYGTLFIDELSLESIFKGGNLSAIAFTLGFESVDPVNKKFFICPGIYKNKSFCIYEFKRCSVVYKQ